MKRRKRMQKVNLLSELERLQTQLRAAAAVIVYAMQGGDVTKPINIEVLGQMPVRRLTGEDVEVDGVKCVQYSLRPERKPAEV